MDSIESSKQKEVISSENDSKRDNSSLLSNEEKKSVLISDEKNESENRESDTKQNIPKSWSSDPKNDNKSAEQHLWSKGMSVWMPFRESHRHSSQILFEILESFQTINIYDNIDILDNLLNESNVSKNCFTVCNESYQKVFYVGSAQNRTITKYLAFTLRVIDQYSRHVFIRKYFNCCSDCRCLVLTSDGRKIRNITQIRPKDKSIEFIISDPQTNNRKFSIKQLFDSQIKHKFDIYLNDIIIGNILKILAKTDPENDPHHLSARDSFIRISIMSKMCGEDKALILSSALIINILFLRKI